MLVNCRQSLFGLDLFKIGIWFLSSKTFVDVFLHILHLIEDGKTYQTVTIWIVTIWKHFIWWLISGMKIFQHLFGMKYIQMVTGKWYENYSDRTQNDLVWTSFIWWLVIGMKISYCHQMNCHHLKYPLNITL